MKFKMILLGDGGHFSEHTFSIPRKDFENGAKLISLKPTTIGGFWVGEGVGLIAIPSSPLTAEEEEFYIKKRIKTQLNQINRTNK